MAQETRETHELAVTTLENLQHRLQRLEYFISGSDKPQEPLEAVISNGREHNIMSRLAKLEHTLYSLGERSPIIHELLQLQLSAVVTAHAPLYPLTASRLTLIHDINIPSSSLSSSLIALKPRLAQLARLQDAQVKEMMELRATSAKVVQRWYELGVLAQGECWAEWEGRMEQCEKSLSRLESGRRREMEEKERYLPS
ncbi:MAG: hypothetical protein LQ348_000254 [Seirophora lacunosa]|nr:MAG: hypothetical protein LQ348_000254 [Seirophora lacunosa]